MHQVTNDSDINLWKGKDLEAGEREDLIKLPVYNYSQKVLTSYKTLRGLYMYSLPGFNNINLYLNHCTSQKLTTLSYITDLFWMDMYAHAPSGTASYKLA